MELTQIQPLAHDHSLMPYILNRLYKSYIRLIVACLAFCFSPLASASASDIQAVLDSTDGSSGFIVQDSSNAAKIRLLSNGNMGIGTTTPLGSLELIKTTGVIPVMVSSSASSHGDYFSITSDGNVGINTVNPVAKLQLRDGAYRLTNTGDSKDWELAYDATGDYVYVSEVGAARHLVIANGGNVGISSLAPSGKLDVNGDVRIGLGTFNNPGSNMDLYVTGNLEVDGNVWLGDAVTDNLTVTGVFSQTGETSFDTIEVRQGIFVNTAGGNVGVGTNAADASVEILQTGVEPAFMVSDTAAGNGDLVMITSGGNVGIGSTAPSQLLDINGDVRVGLGTFNNPSANTDLYLTGNLEVDGSVWLGDASADNLTVTGAFNLDGAYIVDTTDPEALLVRKDADGGDVFTVNTTSSLATLAGNLGIGTIASSASVEVVQVASRPYLKLSASNGAQGDVLAVTSSGNVGITSTAPGSKLDINSGDVRIGATGTFNNTSADEDLYVKGNLEIDGSVWLGDNAVADNLTVTGRMNMAGGMTLDSLEVTGNTFLNSANGNVGIGSTVADASLEIVKQLTDPYLMLSATAAGDGDVVMVTNAGNVGIGSVAPGQLLDVNGAIRARATNALYLGDDNEVSINASTAMNGELRFLTNATEYMRITSAGNVGIGSLAPSQLLDVNGDVRIGLGTFNNASANTDVYVSGNLEVDGSVWLGDAAADNLTVTGTFSQTGDANVSGNFGIGTNTPQTKLAVQGPVGIGTWTTQPGVGLSVQNGNVGIGTITPTDILNVVDPSGITEVGIGINDAAAANLHIIGTRARALLLNSPATGVTTNDGTYLSVSSATDFNIANQENGSITLATNSIERLRITNLGNVGVGTTTPASNLSVLGALGVGDKSYAVDYAAPSAGAIIQGNVGIGTFDPLAKFIVAGGNVGIGSFAPSQLLDVNGDVRVGLGTFNNASADTDVYVSGNLEVDGSVWLGDAAVDNLTVTGAFALDGAYIIDTTDVEGLLVRKDGDAGDVFTVNTTSSLVSVTGNVGVGTVASSASVEVVKSGSVPYMKLSASGGSPGDVVMVTNAGNVGIGSVAPGQLLDVNGAIRARATNALYLGDDNEVSINASTATNGELRFLTNATEYMRITSAGNVGIGSTAPSQLLDVNGDVRVGLGTFNNASANADVYVSGNLEVDGSSYLGDDALVDNLTVMGRMNMSGGMTLDTLEVTGDTFLNTSAGNVGIGSTVADASLEVVKQSSDPYLMLSATAAGNGDVVMVTSAGNVGLGTVTPGQVLDVAGNTRVRGTNALILGDDNEVSINASAATNGELRFLTNNAEYMRLTSAGNVGIGSTAPSQLLDVNGDVRIGLGTFNNATTNADLYVTGNLEVDGSVALGDASADNLTVTGAFNLEGAYVVDATDVEALLVRKDGDAGDVFTVNTTSSLVSVTGNVGVGTVASSASVEVVKSGSVPYLKLSASGGAPGDVVMVTNAGNVGIGSVAPGQLLDVNGAIRARATNAVYLGDDNEVSINASTATNGELRFLTNATEYMRITSAGNVGIGSLAPSQLLDVNGDVRVGLGTFNNASANTDVYVSGNLEVDGSVWLGDAAADNLTVTGTFSQTGDANVSGNFGIGTNTPQTKLAVQGPVGIGTWTTQPGVGLSVMSGNVGIGSVYPSDELSVVGDALITGSVVGNNNGRLDILQNTLVSNGSGIELDTAAINVVAGNGGAITLKDYNGVTYDDNLYISSLGNVGIATTSPGSKLSVLGGMGVGGVSYAVDYNAPVGGAIIEGNVGIGTFDPLAKFIVAAGNVGIGSLAPSQLLDVNGDVRVGLGTFNNASANADVYVSGNIEVDGSSWLGDSMADSLTVMGTFSQAGDSTVGGNFGVGTTTPQTKVAVLGPVGIGTWTTQPGAGLTVLNGNVGIGTITPGQLVDINGSLRTTGTNAVYVGSDNSVGIQPSAASGGDLKLLTASIEQARITAGGNLGLGTSTPASKLAVLGGLGVGDKSYAVDYAAPSAGAIIQGNVGIGTFDPLAKFIVAGGNVGIGSLAPSQLLDVNGDVRIGLGTFNNASANTDLYVTGNIEVDGSVFLGDATVDNITVTGTFAQSGDFTVNGGNLGVGTTTPQTALAVTRGSVGIGTWTAEGGALMVRGGNVGIGTLNTTTSAALYVQQTAAADAFRVDDVDGGDASPFVVAADGNVGVGSVAPGQVLDVAGNARVRGTNALILGDDNEVSINASTATNGELRFLTNATEYMRITSAGNVGIGSLAPSQLLDVNGDVRVGLGTFNNASANTDVYVSGNLEVDGSVWLGDAAADNLTVTGTFSQTGDANVSGNFGIGTNTPQTKLAVQGPVGIGTWTMQDGVGLAVLNGNVGLGYANANSQLVVSANVGIGTFAANAFLDISSTTAQDLLRVNDNGTADATPFIIAADGNVGIGTVLPNNNLSIDNASAGVLIRGVVGQSNDYFDVYTNPTSNSKLFAIDAGGRVEVGAFAPATGLVGISSDGAEPMLYLYRGNSQTGDALRFESNTGTHYLSLTATGNLGIGSAAPSQLLDVNGDVRIGLGTFNNASANTDLYVTGNLEVDGSTWLGDALVDSLSVTGTFSQNGDSTVGGNFGVGTTTPQTKVAILGPVGIGTWTTQPGAGLTVLNGNVGIGTITPGQLVDINGSLRTTGTNAVYVGSDNSVGIQPSAASGGDLKLLTASIEQARITAGGNLGVGTTAPGSKLAVLGGLGVGDKSYAVDYAAPSAGAIIQGNVGIGTFDPLAKFIVASGNVGIGSLAPSQMLDVNGDVRIGLGTFNNASANTDLYVTGNIEVDGSVFLGDATVDNITVTGTFAQSGDFTVNGGNLGVGTTTPQTALAVTRGSVGIGTWTADGGALMVRGGNVGIGTLNTTTSAALYVQQTATADAFRVDDADGGDTSPFIISSDGNVGVGSVAPGFVVDVSNANPVLRLNHSGTGAVRGLLLNNTADGARWLVGNNATANNAFYLTDLNDATSPLIIEDAAPTDSLRILTASGNVGMGGDATPDATLEVAKKGAYAPLMVSSGVNTDGDYLMVTSTGNVGIGSLAPSQLLDVNGDVRVGLGTFNNASANTDVYVSGNLEVDGSVWLGDAAADNLTVTGTFSQTGDSNVSGNFGVGTTTPQTKLAVQGPVGIGTWTTQAGVGLSVMNGNIGIGTVETSYVIDIKSSGAAVQRYLRVLDSNNTNQFGLDSDGSGNAGFYMYDTDGTVDVRFLTNGASYVAGNLGIGAESSNGLRVGLRQTSIGVVPVSIGNSGGNYPGVGYNVEFQADGTYKYLAVDTASFIHLGSNTGKRIGFNLAASGAAGNAITFTEAMSIVDDGNVGIGSLAPGSRLDVSGGDVRIATAGTFNNPSVTEDLYVEGNLEVDGSVYLGDAAADNLTVTGTFSQTGNLGIGTTTPQTLLAVQGGNVGIGTWTSDANRVAIVGGTAIGSATYANTAAPTNGLLVQGNVGIGSVAPTVQLEVKASSGDTRLKLMDGDSTKALQLGSYDDASTVWGLIESYDFGAAALLPLYYNSSKHYFGGGNVGINTVNPSVMFEVATTTGLVANFKGTTTTGVIYQSIGDGTNLLYSGVESDAGGALFTGGLGNASALGTGGATALQLATNNNVRATIDATGNVGIGTILPVSPLTIKGSGDIIKTISAADHSIVSSNIGSGSQIDLNNIAGDLRLRVNSVDTLNVTSGGNVGIGSTAPGSKFDVNGDVRIGLGTFNNASVNNDLYVTGNIEVDGSVFLGDATVDNITVTGSFAQSGNFTVNGGNLGVGTTTPQAFLAVQGGNVGIGTWTSDANRVAIVGNTAIGSVTYANAPAPVNGLIVEGNVGIGTWTATGGALMVRGGNVGIGTLSVATSANVHVVQSAAADALRVDDADGDTSPFVISSDGNVGVGTTSTQDKLVVLGGNIGIGTWTPVEALDIRSGGDLRIGSGTYDNNGAAASSLYVTGNVEVDGVIYGTVVGGAPDGAEYLVSALNGVLTNEDLITEGLAIDYTNGAGTGTFAFDPTELINNRTWADGSDAAIDWTWNLSGVDPVVSFGSNAIGIKTGNFGVGTTAPQAGFVVTNGNVGIGTWTAASSVSIVGGVSIGAVSYANITAPDNGLIVSGNIGVGSSAPSQKLDVNGDVRIGLGTFNNNSSNNDLYVTGNLEVDGSAYLGDNATVDNITVTGTFSQAGNLGIGTTTPQTLLAVQGGNVGIGTWTSDANRVAIVGGVAIGSEAYVNTSAPTGGLIVSGNVGIGTNLPNAGLDIKATVAFEPSAVAAITAGGGITVTQGIMRIAGSGGAVDISANPQIVDGVADGQLVTLLGTSDVNTVKLDNGTGLKLSSAVSFTMGNGDIMTLIYDQSSDLWTELSRTNN